MPESTPGFEPLPKIETHYVLLADGVLSRVTVEGDAEPPVLPDGARWITQEAYEEARAKMLERHEARVAEMEAVEAQMQRDHFDALRAAGIAEATARALSGFTGTVTGGES